MNLGPPVSTIGGALCFTGRVSTRRRNFLRARVRRAFFDARRSGDRYCAVCGSYRRPSEFTGEDPHACDHCRGLRHCKRCRHDRPVIDFGSGDSCIDRDDTCNTCRGHRPLTAEERATLTAFLAAEQPVQSAAVHDGVVLGRDRAGRPVRLTAVLRDRHLCVIGKPHCGKAALLKNLFLQDMAAGHGCALLDLQGDTALELLGMVPPGRLAAATYFAPATSHGPTFNPLALPYPAHAVADDLVWVFRMLFGAQWGPPLEQLLGFGLLTLLADRIPHTLADLYTFYVAPNYRAAVAAASPSPRLRAFWQYEFPSIEPGVVNLISGKLAGFLTPLSPLERLLSTTENLLDFDALLGGGQVLIANLSRDVLGEEAARLLGGLLFAAIRRAARGRADQALGDPRRFYLYVPEFHGYAGADVETVLREAAAHRLNLTLVDESLEQLAAPAQRAVVRTAGGIVAFQSDGDDAVALHRAIHVRRPVRASTGTLYDHDAACRAMAAPVGAQVRELLGAACLFPDDDQPNYPADRIDRLMAEVQRVRDVVRPDDLTEIDWPRAADFGALPPRTAFVRTAHADTVCALTLDVSPPSDARTRARILERPRWRDPLPRARANGESTDTARGAHLNARPPRPRYGRRNGRALQRHGR
jgi:hypothetical protein